MNYARSSDGVGTRSKAVAISKDAGATWVLIDLSWLAHRAAYAMGGLSHGGELTGVIYGVLEQLRVICFDPKVRSSRLAIFKDSAGSLRRSVFPQYKARPPATPEQEVERTSFRRQVSALVDFVFPKLGVSVYSQEGLESDDLMAESSEILEQARQFGVMITADGDLHQAINNWVTWYDPSRSLLLTVPGHQERFGISPRESAEVKEISGCKSDGVPGIPGIGIKTAIAYVRNELAVSTHKYKAIVSEQGEQIRKRNRQLVRLPHLATDPVELRSPFWNPQGFEEVCKEYGLGSYLNGPAAADWRAILEGRVRVEDRQEKRRRGELR